jgi:hypothetical protein
MEAEAIRARVRAARAQLIKDQRFAGGGVAYGYRSAPKPDGPGRVLVKHPDCIGWLSEAVQMAQRGSTVNAIATWLTAEGAPLPGGGKTRRNAENRVWNRQTVDGLLRNPVLAGMTPHNPGRGKSDKRVNPFAVVRDEAGMPVVDDSLALITVEEFANLQRCLDSRTSPQARKRFGRESTSPFLSRVARCDTCDEFMYRGTNQKRPVLYCPRCRQTLSRVVFDPYLVGRLLAERGDEPFGPGCVQDRWLAAGADERARRDVLLSQVESLRIRRGVVGRRFDEDRILLRWRAPAGTEVCAAEPDQLPTGSSSDHP